MFASYPACIFKDRSGYSVVFPDLDYLATEGKNIDEAMKMAVDALAGYIFSSSGGTSGKAVFLRYIKKR